MNLTEKIFYFLSVIGQSGTNWVNRGTFPQKKFFPFLTKKYKNTHFEKN